MLRIQPVMNTFAVTTQNVSNKKSQPQNTNLLKSTNQCDTVSFGGLKKYMLKAIEHLRVARNSRNSESVRAFSREKSEALLARHNSELKAHTQRKERLDARRVKDELLK